MDEFDERKTDLVLGQDRELLYISIDLKWFASYLFDKNFYASVFKNFIKYLYINLINNESDKYMTDINAFIAYIRRAQRTSTIKCFQGDYKQAEVLSRLTGKPILLYIEDNNFDDPSISSVSLRLALSDVTLGNYINDNFIFCIGNINHKPTKRLLQALGISKTFPILAIIGPIFKTNSKGKIIKLKGFDGSLETLAVYSYTIHEIKSYKMLKYLQRIRDSLGVKLLAEKKLFDSLVN